VPINAPGSKGNPYVLEGIFPPPKLLREDTVVDGFTFAGPYDKANGAANCYVRNDFKVAILQFQVEYFFYRNNSKESLYFTLNQRIEPNQTIYFTCKLPQGIDGVTNNEMDAVLMK
jgi:hypothetical protein